ncbi:MAG: UDP-N-acetylmuramoyl-L-alanyl-D-glutamate--2,6-diaminopimelate ligase [Ignavibacteria bacterium]|nr:UDP-N-acetylmuramoyl-L-alanyl-D-glutamate--2,6-diaminopimelate ligase [Bacteroidota bacterium]MSQ46469.1 UDP-N-acetylmuramoyl-L-alanyl-D-glutamate--2,6-diaminopimelate ligase [Ignavibacteria bacterium]
MKLSELIQNVGIIKFYNTIYGQTILKDDIHISRVQYNSSQVQKNDLFVAIRGKNIDGHKFIGEAISKGARVVVVEDETSLPDSLCMHQGVAKLVVLNSRKTLAQLANNYFNKPSEKLQVIGITGTNGKTTTTYLVKQMLEQSNFPNVKVGLIGTIEYDDGKKTFPATHTTPESLEIQSLISEMVNNNCTHVVMEVSSHALHQHRIEGINFKAAIFTNLTQDHLDYHNSMDEYLNAKKILFDSLSPSSFAVTNIDSEYGKKIVANTKANVISYSTKKGADISAHETLFTTQGFTTTIFNHKSNTGLISASLLGNFNLENFLAAYSTLYSLGIKWENINSVVQKLKPAPGRLQKIASPKNWIAIVDYAHTPDALKNCLEAIRPFVQEGKKLITLFGAGGDRDKSKRSIMGSIAEQLSDVVVVTSDNPRTENPEKIIEDILTGMKKNKITIIESDRKIALTKALEQANSGDVVVVAGKGHEEYQVIGNNKIHFSDVEIIEEYIKNL